MDSEGYLPVSLIASFHRVQALSADMELILTAMKESDKLDLLDDLRVRTKDEPLKWPVSPLVNGELQDSPPKVAPAPKPVVSAILTSIPPPPMLRKKITVSVLPKNLQPAAEVSGNEVEAADEGPRDDPSLNPNVTDFVPTKAPTKGEADIWKEVKRRSKSQQGKEAVTSKVVEPTVEETPKKKSGEKEELDFQFDEEIEIPHGGGRANQFSENWSDDEDDFELSDKDINKLLIVTQVRSSFNFPHKFT